MRASSAASLVIRSAAILVQCFVYVRENQRKKKKIRFTYVTRVTFVPEPNRFSFSKKKKTLDLRVTSTLSTKTHGQGKVLPAN